ncbi:diacylglycerol/lipid kinase family protein [Lacrimispora sp. 210928-DFI.3.58]|uniref:diacylglycerol/lipid kinase family protein n=1 Tax=Lacrimispora sp. 210928-DFI.3.58 TaxID=2883214 RepID=UPI001D065C7C|nr:diacylglycerol kinase family protein [Lacrimispora sp. 210928-DFI.3.58]MCB7318360.1 diacylglycerol kinase family lipid kinase [Lacrimispora sp. 210928-DFI.3.58]
MYNFIVNPNAGSGRGLKTWNAISRYLEQNNIEYEVCLTASIGEARSIARELTEGAKDPKFILVVGGDGTMNEVLDGISFHLPLSLGYIPAGTGNDLSRSLRLPGNRLKCLKKQLTPRHFTMIDYGVLSYGTQEVSHRRFLVSAGIGYDAAVCQDVLSSTLRQRLGCIGLDKLSYIIFGIRQFFRSKTSKGYIILDGVKKIEFNNILFISCHIQPSEGGGFLFAPKADGSDGRMNISVFSHPTRRKLIPVLLSAAARRRGKRKGVRSYECREVVIHTDAALPVHVDGEFCGLQTDIQAGCIPRKVRMMV